MTDREQVRRALREKARRRVFPDAVEGLKSSLFPLQQALVNDPSRRITGKAGRRGGKTVSAQAWVLDAAKDYPNITTPVCETTLGCSAAVAFWESLIAFDDLYKLKIDFHHTFKIATLPNRHRIQLMGTATKEQCDKLRGGKYRRLVIDECGTYRSDILHYLITQVAEPALVDLDGSMLTTGTPGHKKKGTWFDLCHSAFWSQHHWTMLDNPYIPDGNGTPEEKMEYRLRWLRELRERNGWDEAHPTFLREYMGVWAEGTGDLMYESFDPTRNVLPALPDSNGEVWRYGLGIDYGVVDPTAFVVVAWRRSDPCVYIIESFCREGMSPSTAAIELDKLRARYRFSFIVADANGIGKAFVAEFEQTYGVKIEAARKPGKALQVAFVDGDFATGRLQLIDRGTRELQGELHMLPWDANREDAAPDFSDHEADAMRYAVRKVRAQLTTNGDPYHDPASPEALEAFEAQLQAEVLAACKEAEPEVDEEWQDRFFRRGDWADDF